MALKPSPKNMEKNYKILNWIKAISAVISAVGYLVKVYLDHVHHVQNRADKKEERKNALSDKLAVAETEHRNAMELLKEKCHCETLINEQKHKNVLEELELRQNLWETRQGVQKGCQEDSTAVSDCGEWTNLDEVDTTGISMDTPKLLGTCIPRGSRCAIYSKPGVGKSTLTKAFMKVWADGKGKDFWTGKEVFGTPLEVFAYDSEQSKEENLKFFGLQAPHIHIKTDFNFYSADDFLQDMKNTISSIDHDCVVVVDNITHMFPAMTAEQTRKFCKDLQNLQNDYSNNGFLLTIVIVFHSVKNAKGKGFDDVAGSANWARFFTSIFSIQPTAIGDCFKILKCDKMRGAREPDDVILSRIDDQNGSRFEFSGKDANSKPGSSNKKDEPELTTEDVEEMKKLRNSGASFQNIADTIGAAKGKPHANQIRRILNKYDDGENIK